MPPWHCGKTRQHTSRFSTAVLTHSISCGAVHPVQLANLAVLINHFSKHSLEGNMPSAALMKLQAQAQMKPLYVNNDDSVNILIQKWMSGIC